MRQDEREFDIGIYINGIRKDTVKSDATKKDLDRFMEICKIVKAEMESIDAEEMKEESALERQRKMLLGLDKEVGYYKNKIREILGKKGLTAEWFPTWYKAIEDGIYNEIYGFAGISEWIQGTTEELANSSSCKIIGENIFFLINGELELQPQKISEERRERLKETLLLTDPMKDRAAPYHELYLSNGSRVTIFNDNGLAKYGQDCLVFRKYHVNVFTFEEQASRHTIPYEAIPFFKYMVRCGFNVVFTGPVRSAKTTLLTTYQSYEKPKLEGLLIESDPEIPLHKIMPNSPIMQLVPSDKNMDIVISTAKRSDAAYLLIGEAREGRVLNIAIEAANMGTKRSKLSFHNTETTDFCYDVAEKITRDCGGDLGAYMIKASKSFHYIINMFSLPTDLSQKRLKGIWEVRYDNDTMEITMRQICKYRIKTDDWEWKFDIGTDKEEIGLEEDPEAIELFKDTLKELEKKQPYQGNHVFIPPYIKVMGIGRK